MLTVVYQYLSDLELLIEGCSTDNIDKINWDDSRPPAVKVNRALSHVCRHDKSFTPDNSGYINMEAMTTKRPSVLTPGKFLAIIYAKPNLDFSRLSQCTARAAMGLEVFCSGNRHPSDSGTLRWS